MDGFICLNSLIVDMYLCVGGSSSGTSQFMDDMAPKVLQSFAQDLEALESSPASALSLASRSRKLEEFLCFVLKDMMMRFNKCSSEVRFSFFLFFRQFLRRSLCHVVPL